MTKLKNFFKKLLSEDFILRFWHYPRSVLAALLYGFPAGKMTVIGVAGTKGKTTTCHLIAQVLETAGKKTAMISTAVLKIGSKEELNPIKMTTPSPFFLQKFIKKAAREKCEYLVLETSSHALVQHRTFGILFKTAVLTNLMPDHLEYHTTAKDYQLSHKKMINSRLRFFILNADDPNLDEFLKMSVLDGKKITYGFDRSKDVFAKDIFLSPTGSSFLVKTPKGSIKINLSLLGKFNVYNALAALTAVLSEKIDLEAAKIALEKFKGAPGRTEEVNCGQNFKVIVDYAHSPDSLNNLFAAISFFRQGKTIVVFGACGERDPEPRPQMGKILDQNADFIIVTNDDPFGEDPEKIAKDLMAGIENKVLEKNLWKILDRKLAIEKGISLAQEGDLVLILGKGAEQWQVFKDKKIPWDDRKITAEILEKNK